MTTAENVREQRARVIKEMSDDVFPNVRFQSYLAIERWATIFRTDRGGYYMSTATTMHGALESAGDEVSYYSENGDPVSSIGVAVVDLDERQVYPIQYTASVPDGSGESFHDWIHG